VGSLRLPHEHAPDALLDALPGTLLGALLEEAVAIRREPMAPREASDWLLIRSSLTGRDPQCSYKSPFLHASTNNPMKRIRGSLANE
jgi:hypothetical protein